MTRTGDFRSFLPGLYAVAALLIIAPLADVIGAAWPLRPTDVGWRFGSIGLGLGVIVIQIIGFALAMAIAAASGHRLVLRFLSIVCLLAAAALVAGITRFILDYGQIRPTLAASNVTGVDSSSFRALLVATLAVPVLVTLGGRGLATTKREAVPASPQPRAPHPQNPTVIPFPGRAVRPFGSGR